MHIVGAYNVKTRRNPSSGAKYEYVHFIKGMNIVTEPLRLHDILKSAFAGLAMKCVVSSVPPEMSAVKLWLDGLHDLPNLHFDSTFPDMSDDFALLNIDIDSLIIGDPSLPRPAPEVLQEVPESVHLLAFDLETHDLAKNSIKDVQWIQGRFGHPCRFRQHSQDHLHMIQLGWCMMSSTGSNLIQKKYNVLPSGFEVTVAATSKHGLTNKELHASGKPIREVLHEFMFDVASVIQKGGAVCAHQLEFDAGIIAIEMERAGLHDKFVEWEHVVQRGFCTMNPTVTRWSGEIYFDVTGAKSILSRGAPVGLCNLVLALIPKEYHLLHNHHDAAADAYMVWKLVVELQRRLVQYREATQNNPLSRLPP